MRKHKNIHLNPFPNLLKEEISFPNSLKVSHLTKYQKNILHNLRRGAQILLDINKKKALLYIFSNGIKKISRISIRTLYFLIKQGLIHIQLKENNRLFFTINY